MFIKLNIPIAVVKLYKNRIENVDAIAELLSWGKGCVGSGVWKYSHVDPQLIQNKRKSEK